MGRFAQNRLIRKLDLERFLSNLDVHPSPDVALEQYTLSESCAATMLHLAAYTYGDIIGKKVVDLGCGTGRLSLGSSFLGAEFVVGVDIDRVAIKTAVKNSLKAESEAKVGWILGDIDAVGGAFDTVVQNPPFGVQRRGADRRFLEKATNIGTTVYSFHNHPRMDKRLISNLKDGGSQPFLVEASPFIRRLVESWGWRIEAVHALPLVIPRMFDFHTKKRHEIVVDLYVLRKS
jgi:putative methylase